MKRRINLIRILRMSLLFLSGGGLVYMLAFYAMGLKLPAYVAALYSILIAVAWLFSKKREGVPSLIGALIISGLYSTLMSYLTGRDVMWPLMYFAIFFVILFFTPFKKKKLIILESAIMVPLAMIATYFTFFGTAPYEIPHHKADILLVFNGLMTFTIIASGVILGKIAMARSARKLDEHKRLLNAIFDSSSEPDFMISPGLKLISYNRAAYEFIRESYGSELKREMSLSDVLSSEEEEGLLEEIEKCKEGKEVHFEVAIGHAPAQKWFEVKLLQVHDSRGKLWGINIHLTDITERRNFHEELSNLALVASEINTAVIVSNYKNEIEWVNNYFTRLSGYTAEEVIGKDPTILHGPDTSKEEVKRINNLLAKGQPLRSEIINYRKDGHRYWIDLIVKPILDENGRVIKFFSIHNDITRIKEREFALERSERLLKRMEEAAHLGAWEHDLETGDFFTTKEINRILQYAAAKNLTLNEILNRIDTHSDANARQLIEDLMESGESFDEIVAMNTATGDLKQIRIIGKARKEQNGKGKVYGVFQDVTNSIRSENKLRESKALIEAINKNIQDGIYRSTVNKGLIYANEAFAKIFGYDSVEEVMKADIIRFYHDDADRSKFLAMMEKKGVVKNFEVRLKRKDGRLFWGEISATISNDSRGEICIDGSVRDITALKETQLALLKAKEKAEKASMAKAEFLSVMSHEIRTPMNAVIGMTELLLMEKPREDQMDYLQTLKFSAGNLLNIINDILDYSKIDAGKIEFEALEFKVSTLLNSLIQSIRPRLADKKIALKMELDPLIPDIVVGDPTRLSQVLTNLLSNAAKFTHEGRIVLRAELAKKEKESLAIRFSVKDTGIGIPKAKQAEIFKSFAQADASITRKYGGTGLGLAITKRLLELQGSEIQLNSTAGKGSEFFFTLKFRYNPRQKAGSAAVNGKKAEIETQDLSGMHILIVEDNIINLKLTERFLQKWNAHTDSAKNGLEGFEKIKKNPEAYDAVLMDLQMPVMDGYTATAKIREINTRIPILALTASAMLEIQERVYASGMNDYITKPINAQELNVKLSKYRKA